MDLERVCIELIAAAQRLGVVVPSTLPLLDASPALRGVDEIVCRLLVMQAAAYAFDRSSDIAWLHQETLIDAVSAHERRFLFNGKRSPDGFKVGSKARGHLLGHCSSCTTLSLRQPPTASS